MSIVRRILLIIMLAVPVGALAQVEDAIEQWLVEEGSEEAAAELNDLMLQLRQEPLNVNDTHSMGLLPFISPFQLKALRNYMLLHGQLLTVRELHMVPGFDSATVALLGPYLVAKPYAEYERPQWWRGKHTIVSGLGGTVEEAEGYRNGSYEGDRLRALLSYTYNFHNRVTLRLSADKDPAEAWGKDNYYSGQLVLRDIGWIKTLVVGRYNLQFGQGMTLWTGLAPFNLTGTSAVRYAAGVRQAGVFNEQDWQQGAAATIGLGRGVEVSAFGSRKEGEWLGGAHVGYRRGNIIAGMTAVGTWLDDSLQLRDYAYNQTYFRGQRTLNLGLDAMYQHGPLLLFGEVAMGENGHMAGIGGLRISTGGDNSIGLTARHYDPLYHNLHAQAYAMSTTRNEQGLALDARMQLPWRVTSLLSIDLHRYPAPRYGAYSPSTGNWLRAQLQRQLGRHLEAEVRYAYRRKERNVPNLDSTLYLGEHTLRQQAQLQVRYHRGPWRLTTRLIAAWFAPERSERQNGWLVAQEARYSGLRWQAVAQAAIFDIGGYYARIFLSESNLQYAFSIPSLYGRGARVSAVLRWDVSRWLDLSAKYTLTAYPEQEHIGSDDAQTEGPTRQTWHLQLRWKF